MPRTPWPTALWQRMFAAALSGAMARLQAPDTLEYEAAAIVRGCALVADEAIKLISKRRKRASN